MDDEKNDEIDKVINQWWDLNLKLRLLTSSLYPEDKEYIIDVQKLKEDFENIPNNLDALKKIYFEMEKINHPYANEILEEIIENYALITMAEIEKKLYNFLIQNPLITIEKLNNKLKKELEWNDKIIIFPSFKIVNFDKNV
ncbi:MAG: hypothetical protein QXX42_01830 [Thermoplasmatales archaeon]